MSLFDLFQSVGIQLLGAATVGWGLDTIFPVPGAMKMPSLLSEALYLVAQGGLTAFALVLAFSNSYGYIVSGDPSMYGLYMVLLIMTQTKLLARFNNFKSWISNNVMSSTFPKRASFGATAFNNAPAPLSTPVPTIGSPGYPAIQPIYTPGNTHGSDLVYPPV